MLRRQYIIEKTNEPKPWRLMVIQPRRSTGTILSHYASRAKALTTARLLAGRDADILEVKP